MASVEGGSFMDTLPDPMKLQLPTVLFVIVLVTLLFFFLKYVLFQPLTRLMDDRDQTIQAGQATKSEASVQIEQRQAEYAARLRELKAQAFERRKALTAEASAERQAILEKTRQQSLAQLGTTLEALNAEKETAKVGLLAQVEALSKTMVQQLLKQA
jgi:F-type H+-transporting ATPase subunit b